MNALWVRRWGMWLLCLGLVLPGVGRAAQVAPTVSTPDEQEQSAPVAPAPEEVREVPGTQEDAPRRLLEDEQEFEEGRAHAGAPRGLRILGEVGGALITSAALAVALGGTVGLVCISQAQGSYDGLGCFILALLGAGVGAGVGVPLGTWWAGEVLGGDGSLLASLGGAVLGAIGGVVVMVALGNVLTRSEAGSTVLSLTIPVTTIAGSIIGYELSQRAPGRWASRGGLQPVLSFTPNATVLGLGGQF